MKRWVAAVVLALSSSMLHAQFLSLTLDGISGAGWQTGKVGLALANPFGAGQARIDIADAAFLGKRYAKLSIVCKSFRQEPEWLRCVDGVMTGFTPEPIKLDFSFSGKSKALELALRPASDEAWLVKQDGRGSSSIVLENALLTRVSEWLPEKLTADPFFPKPAAGRVSGNAQSSAERVAIDLKLHDMGFADSSGLRAGEKINAVLTGRALASGGAWQWDGALDWRSGEVFWQPFYVKVPAQGHRLSATGTLTDKELTVRESALNLAGVGDIKAAASLTRADNVVQFLTVAGREISVPGLFALLPKEWLESAGVGDLIAQGGIDFSVAMADARLSAVELKLTDALIDIPSRKSGLFGLSAYIPWRAGQTSEARLDWKGGLARGIPIGPVEARAQILKDGVYVPSVVIPVLDGVIGLAEIRARKLDTAWEAELQGAFTPISMEQLALSQGWPKLGGVIHGNIPRISYAKSTLGFDGALDFEVFEGKARATGIRIEDPFGKTPSFKGELTIRNMDLELLTNAFSFGSITGKIDVDVLGLELESWQPVAFDARVITSEGNFTKRISQRAVQNISSVGGAGAGAAIQASVLRFFDTFGYQKIGLSCKLSGNICNMGGVEDSTSGYVMVKGGGVPSLPVVGYNRQVGWLELLDRIKAATKGELKPEIR